MIQFELCTKVVDYYDIRTRLIIIRTFIVLFFVEDYTSMKEQLNRNQDKLLKYINKVDNDNNEYQNIQELSITLKDDNKIDGL